MSPEARPPAVLRRLPAWRRFRIFLWRFRRWRDAWEVILARRFGLATREDRTFFFLIGAVGVVAGCLGLVVHLLIDGLRDLLWGPAPDLLGAARGAPLWLVVGAPAVGGALVGLIAWLGRERELSGQGMSTLIESVAMKGGEVPPRPVILRALAAVATVGSGGSLGREGPMIRLGAMLSSWLAVRAGLPARRIKILVGCGAAAGLAAAYNIPVGGALFAMEVILGNFALEIFGPIVVSSVISTLIARSVRGDVPIYAVPGYGLESGWEILAYAGLGIVGAVASIAFVFGVRGGGRAFGSLRFLPEPLRPVLGMALLGALGLYVPFVLGSGLETITLALQGELGLLLLLVLPAAKLVATALTAGSGCAGGLFTPSLFFGALVGGAYGYGIHALFPGLTGSYGAYAAVGMAAVAAGTSHAPISAILILFEFTGNYDLILPLMISAILASAFSRRLYPHSIYTYPLRRKGVELPWRMEEAVLAGLKVEDLVRPDAETLRPDQRYKEVVERFLGIRRQRLFVVDSDGRLQGAVSLHDIKHALENPGALTAVVAHDLATPVGIAVRPEDRLHRAAEAFARSDYERLPVVEEGGRYRGLLAKRDLLAVYAQEVLGRPALLATFVSGQESEAARDYVELPPDFTIRLVRARPPLVGKTLAEARLPQALGVRVIEIKRRTPGGEERVIPDSATVVRPGDGLIVLGPSAAVEALERGAAAADEAAAHTEID